MGGLEGVESVALPQGSVCKPLSTPQSCFHKEIYKTGLRCALLPCIMSEGVCVNVCVAQIDPLVFLRDFFFFSLHHLCKKHIHPILPIQAGQTHSGPSGGV